ncbi:pyruvate formate lyase activating enzyme [Desulfatibacillum alkenivorans DSM 16219]|jgi:pyruvate formate lyase activating enzyme|uniref:Pyruvate formate lyase activating enzyme n=1 Tax=Desulfatibacillum alkenivorans DSM 16219 TaxID=1121393 RepID=A0A1M7AXR9_9BACT|nr:AmmeMemoRadiSam system radical SAM enzyme [Desulfatibacillum alkenivorans]SHL47522.1 pyruvate formate lyase activating enzyme [Desulfatibacillum alkenivorans DSM 16219]
MASTRRTFLKAAAAAAGQGILFPLSRALAQELTFDSRTMKEAYFYKTLGGGSVQCLTCPHTCLITPDYRGKCGTKVNLGGKLYSISYANPCSLNVDPVEKKPMHHFLPGSKAFSLAVAGCNFTCLNCQNWEISQTTPDKTRNYYKPPETIVAHAKKYGCKSIAYTYTEATTYYEYMLDTAKTAREQGIKNILVSNAYIRPEPARRLSKYIDGAALNLKSLSDKIYMELNGGHLAPVQEAIKIYKDNGVWVEVIHLVVPTYTDNLDVIRRVAGWVAENLGAETPFQLSRFHPNYRLVHLAATPVAFMKQAGEAAEQEGLKHVYLGNIPGVNNPVQCPSCHKTVVKRRGYYLEYDGVENGCCPFCRTPIQGVWS